MQKLSGRSVKSKVKKLVPTRKTKAKTTKSGRFSKTTPNSVRSNTKEIITKNQNEILSFFDGKTKAEREKGFISQTEHYMENKRNYKTTPYHAVQDMIDDVTIGDPYNYDRIKYLNKLGLNKYKADELDTMPDNKAEKAIIEGNAMYRHLLARDGEKLYTQLKKGKTAPKKTTKRATGKK